MEDGSIAGLTAGSRVRVRGDVAWREVDGEFYLLSADSAFHAVTDPVGAFVLERLTRAPLQDVDALVAAVRAGFEAGAADVAADVAAFLRDLLDKAVLEVVP
jgi:acyl-CoA reductase-like NAD-dependent aldehyde dehydrogenase